MLHLFKKVYIEFDTMLDNNYDRFVVSKEHGFDVLPTVRDIHTGEHIGFAQTYEDLVGVGKRFDTFLNFINFLNDWTVRTNKPVVIFVDKDAFLKLAIRWYKTVFQNAQAPTTYALIQSHLMKVKHLNFPKVTSFNLNDINAVIQQCALTEEEFTGMFNSIVDNQPTAQAFVTATKADLSIEVLLASYLYDGSNKEELKAKLIELLKRDIQGFIMEAKDIVFANITKQSFRDLLGITTEYSYSNADGIQNEPSLFWFFHSLVYNSAETTSFYSGSGINWQHFNTDDVIDQFIVVIKKVMLEWEHVNSTAPSAQRLHFIKYLRDNALTDEQLTEVIDFEINNPGCSGFAGIDRSKFNVYFLDYLLEPFRNQTVVTSNNTVPALGAFAIRS